MVTHTPVNLSRGACRVLTKIIFKPGTQDFPFQINQDQIPKHFISASKFPNQTKPNNDLIWGIIILSRSACSSYQETLGDRGWNKESDPSFPTCKHSLWRPGVVMAWDFQTYSTASHFLLPPLPQVVKSILEAAVGCGGLSYLGRGYCIH